MPDQPKTHTHHVSISDSGSHFSAYVDRRPVGGHRFQGVCVAHRSDFPSRSAALAWGRAKIKELET